MTLKINNKLHTTLDMMYELVLLGIIIIYYKKI